MHWSFDTFFSITPLKLDTRLHIDLTSVDLNKSMKIPSI